MFDRSFSAGDLPPFVRAVDQLNVHDVWLVEDVGWHGSFVQATAALAASERLRVCVGLAPVPLRNPVLYAMEVATLASLYPRRFVAGIGHGSPARLKAAIPGFKGVRLRRLEENLLAVRELLAGQEVTVHGEYVTLDAIKLVHPPDDPVPLYVGAIKPKTLTMAGRCADGTILAEGTTPSLLADNLRHVRAGRAARGALSEHEKHEIVVYLHFLVDADPVRVEEVTRPVIEKFAAMHCIPPSPEVVAAGPAELVAERITDLWKAGADTVVLRPLGTRPVHELEMVLGQL